MFEAWGSKLLYGDTIFAPYTRHELKKKKKKEQWRAEIFHFVFLVKIFYDETPQTFVFLVSRSDCHRVCKATRNNSFDGNVRTKERLTADDFLFAFLSVRRPVHAQNIIVF